MELQCPTFVEIVWASSGQLVCNDVYEATVFCTILCCPSRRRCMSVHSRRASPQPRLVNCYFANGILSPYRHYSVDGLRNCDILCKTYVRVQERTVG